MANSEQRRLPPAQALHAFDAAARHMSFTAAARELAITQAAVSQRIRLLEHQLGQTLFLRHARGLELTEAGRAFLPAVNEAFARLSTGLAEAFGRRAARRSRYARRPASPPTGSRRACTPSSSAIPAPACA
ncbi:MAG: LysR family transcriptional regulator [Halofilum sp. (in: g-proteobacteria)]|nr:LysR family transcriptional regulator [Halofilum sp. (in: g-proteobacteria)]